MKRRPIGYTLIGHEPLAIDDLSDWAAAFGLLQERHATIVAQEYVGPTFVSTVFLGIDYAWSGRPLLFETMTFDGESNLQQRYPTWDDALTGHRRVVARLRANLVAATN